MFIMRQKPLETVHIVYAAACVARELHKGQKDKGGNDYFRSHLLSVGVSGSDWKEQVVGFLHDAAEDTGYDVPTVLQFVQEQLADWLRCPENIPWKDDVDGMFLSGGSFHHLASKFLYRPTCEDWQEIATALHLLNHYEATNREAYIGRIVTNGLAVRVKLNDLRSNMDISRIPHPTEKDYARLERYKKEYELLSRMVQ